MAEFYKDHTHDPDTNGVRIRHPFMGGGTTVVEALRLGCHVTGIDLNPVAWFIVKTEVEPVDLNKLKAAFKRLEERPTGERGNPSKRNCLAITRRNAPVAAREARRRILSTPSNGLNRPFAPIPPAVRRFLFLGNLTIAAKTPSVRYISEYPVHILLKRPLISKWTGYPSWPSRPLWSTIPGMPLATGGPTSAGQPMIPSGYHVTCPWCSRHNPLQQIGKLKKEKKKILLNVLLCPPLPGRLAVPVGHFRISSVPCVAKGYSPQKGNIPDRGNFVCPACGAGDKIITSIRRLPEDQLMPIAPYAIEGYCPRCAGDIVEDLFGDAKDQRNGRPFMQHSRQQWEVLQEGVPSRFEALSRSQGTMGARERTPPLSAN